MPCVSLVGFIGSVWESVWSTVTMSIVRCRRGSRCTFVVGEDCARGLRGAIGFEIPNGTEHTTNNCVFVLCMFIDCPMFLLTTSC